MSTSFDYSKTKLWIRTLAIQGDDDASTSAAREKLRYAYESMRKRVAVLVNEIHADLRHLTVHDITHLDALWEMADMIAGSDYFVTPTEAFVLGGAFLLHDAGMSLAAYPGGLAEIKERESNTWRDTVFQLLKEHQHSEALWSDIDNPPKEIEQEALQEILRELHAKQAERLPVNEWEFNGRKYRIIVDDEIREALAYSIGLVAHSHWWNIDEIDRELNNAILGAPTFCPGDWEIDLLKVASLLRVSDASHIDDRRSPSWLMTLRRPSGYSRMHWLFQNKLLKPRIDRDKESLVYRSKQPFKVNEANAWWLCFDTIRMIDGELRSTGDLLSDRGRKRFALRGVANSESPARLAQDIQVTEWEPLDASVHIKNAPNLIRNLGGPQLYGRLRTVPVRELIQNAADAIQARRLIENHPEDWGRIDVSLDSDEDGSWWLVVKDNGIGMSPTVIQEYLLNFGATYWTSSLVRRDFPRLLSEGFEPWGKFGIGFFSVFMISDLVILKTRRFQTGVEDSLVLEFSSGLDDRPILRKAKASEVLQEGGTEVKLKLSVPPCDEGGFLEGKGPDAVWALISHLRFLCIAMNVDVWAKTKDDGDQQVSKANDWMTTDSYELICRTQRDFRAVDEEAFRQSSDHLSLMHDESGRVVGRLSIEPFNGWPYGFKTGPPPDNWGLITIGGFGAVRMSDVLGVVRGRPGRAARDYAEIDTSTTTIRNWATDQAELISQYNFSPETQMDYSSRVIAYGGNPQTLIFGFSRNEFLDLLKLQTWLRGKKYCYLSLAHSGDRELLDPNEIVMPWPSQGANELMRSVDRTSLDFLTDIACQAWRLKRDQLYVVENNESNLSRDAEEESKHLPIERRAWAYVGKKGESDEFLFPPDMNKDKISEQDSQTDTEEFRGESDSEDSLGGFTVHVVKGSPR